MRIVLFPGLVRNKFDGQTHHVGARQLAELYGLHLSWCVVVETNAQIKGYGDGLDGDIKLYPRIDGKYKPNDKVKLFKSAKDFGVF